MEDKIFGHIKGLLEAWGDEDLDQEQVWRLRELWKCLSPSYIVRMMSEGFPSEHKFLVKIVKIVG